ncbi:MAG TPA: hypothetical protein HPP80_07275, partial [Rhodospirillaceae bacterium]|nr:hypothetical protein [Rhodospirillaceae bacterium]
MHYKTRTSRHNGASIALLALLAFVVVALSASVWGGSPAPRLPERFAAATSANGALPPP